MPLLTEGAFVSACMLNDIFKSNFVASIVKQSSNSEFNAADGRGIRHCF